MGLDWKDEAARGILPCTLSRGALCPEPPTRGRYRNPDYSGGHWQSTPLKVRKLPTHMQQPQTARPTDLQTTRHRFTRNACGSFYREPTKDSKLTPRSLVQRPMLMRPKPPTVQTARVMGSGSSRQWVEQEEQSAAAKRANRMQIDEFNQNQLMGAVDTSFDPEPEKFVRQKIILPQMPVQDRAVHKLPTPPQETVEEIRGGVRCRELLTHAAGILPRAPKTKSVKKDVHALASRGHIGFTRKPNGGFYQLSPGAM